VARQGFHERAHLPDVPRPERQRRPSSHSIAPRWLRRFFGYWLDPAAAREASSQPQRGWGRRPARRAMRTAAPSKDLADALFPSRVSSRPPHGRYFDLVPKCWGRTPAHGSTAAPCGPAVGSLTAPPLTRLPNNSARHTRSPTTANRRLDRHAATCGGHKWPPERNRCARGLRRRDRPRRNRRSPPARCPRGQGHELGGTLTGRPAEHFAWPCAVDGDDALLASISRRAQTPPSGRRKPRELAGRDGIACVCVHVAALLDMQPAASNAVSTSTWATSSGTRHDDEVVGRGPRGSMRGRRCSLLPTA
jgi:hypothetical protein